MTLPHRFLLPVLPLLLGSVACREAGPVAEIEARRTASRPSSPVLPGATASQRFGSEMPPRASGPGATPSAPSDELLSYDVPEGWSELPPSGDRLVNLVPAGNPDAACYLSFLGGSAGGLEANVNRWLAQFGADPLAGEVIAALPRHSMLGKEATLVSVEGTFTGMGETLREDFGLLGLVVSEPTGSLFLKFTGPAALVEAERERFLAFAGSLRLPEPGAASEAHGPDDGHDHGDEHFPGDGHDHGEPAEAAAPVAAQSSGALTWTAPEGWRPTGPRPMREVTFQMGAPEAKAECYVALLPGDAGGLEANLNRWAVQQMGHAPLSAEDVAALPKIELMDAEVPLLALEGDFTDMSGATQTAQGFLGVALIRPDMSVFVKFTGPAELVQAERERFVAFIASLEERP
jgi:hypothetical protein